MGANANTKGKTFEREVAKILTELFSDESAVFHRVSSSGAYTGGKNKVRINKLSAGQVKAQRGDIVAPDHISLVVECKNHAGFPAFHTLLTGKNAKLSGWLREIYNDSDYGSLIHMLVFKITGTATTFFALPERHFNKCIAQLTTHNLLRFLLTADYTSGNKPEQYFIIDKEAFASLREPILKVITLTKRKA